MDMTWPEIYLVIIEFRCWLTLSSCSRPYEHWNHGASNIYTGWPKLDYKVSSINTMRITNWQYGARGETEPCAVDSTEVCISKHERTALVIKYHKRVEA